MTALTSLWWVIPAYIVFSLLLWGVTWILYLAGMSIVRSQPVLYGTSAKLVVPVQYLCGWSSTALNWLVFTVLLLEIPKEQHLSTRLMRHKRYGQGWRQRLATWMGDVWLDPFDPSGHHI